jgi:hypothetical protein
VRVAARRPSLDFQGAGQALAQSASRNNRLCGPCAQIRTRLRMPGPMRGAHRGCCFVGAVRLDEDWKLASAETLGARP